MSLLHFEFILKIIYKLLLLFREHLNLLLQGIYLDILGLNLCDLGAYLHIIYLDELFVLGHDLVELGFQFVYDLFLLFEILGQLIHFLLGVIQDSAS